MSLTLHFHPLSSYCHKALIALYENDVAFTPNLVDLSSLIRLLQTYQPDEVYNLAAQSFVAAPWNQPLLTGQVPSGRHRDDVYCEHYGTIHRQPGRPVAYATMLRTETHKLVAMHGTDPGELYDLRADPSETRNLWDDPGHRQVKLDLYRRLCDRMAWTVDPLPEREANY